MTTLRPGRFIPGHRIGTNFNLGKKKVVKLEGILKGHDIDLSELKKFKQQTWKHVDQEFNNE